MKTTNKLIGITAVLIVILFLGMSMQPSVVAHSQNSNAISVKQQVEYGKHFNQRPVNAKQQAEYNRYFIQNPVNATEQLSNAFMTWYINKENANPYIGGHISKLHMPQKSHIKKLLSTFLEENPSAVILLKQITKMEKERFAIQNHKVYERFISALKNGKLNKTTKYTVTSGNSVYAFSRMPMSGPPSNVLGTSGKWGMVSINYFTYTLGSGWFSITETYGEQDNFNTVYSGSPAQTFYNKITGFASVDSILTGLFAGAIFGLALGAIAGIIAGLAVYIVFSIIHSELRNIYQSTYSNNNWGDKYMWMVMQNDYYYNWIDIAQDFTSTVNMYGYLSNGNTQSIFPQLPTLFVGSAYLSNGAHSFGNSHGLNNWVYVGY